MLKKTLGTMASPLSPGHYERSAEADLDGCAIKCPLGQYCIELVCGGSYCPLPECADCPACNAISKRSLEPALADRQFDCPSGIECGPGPVCTEATCDLPGCADAEVCQDRDQERSLVER